MFDVPCRGPVQQWITENHITTTDSTCADSATFQLRRFVTTFGIAKRTLASARRRHSESFSAMPHQSTSAFWCTSTSGAPFAANHPCSSGPSIKCGESTPTSIGPMTRPAAPRTSQSAKRASENLVVWKLQSRRLACLRSDPENGTRCNRAPLRSAPRKSESLISAFCRSAPHNFACRARQYWP